MPNSPECRADYLAKKEAEAERLRTYLAGLPAGEYVLELGCGHGHFLNALAQRDNQAGLKRYYFGVDKNPERIEKCQKKANRLGLDNLFFIRAKIEELLPLWRKELSVREIFVLFPDPWPRARHHKHRFVNEELFGLLRQLACADVVFHYRGDHDEYTSAIRQTLENNPYWEISKDNHFPVGLPSTVFEGHHPRYQTLAALRRRPAK